jgi:cation diffusion facilitator CzcD-associated flavoprotein CzcO
LETNYFEAYNDPRVRLVDIEEAPIERITESGVQLQTGEHVNLDVLIYATGYDAITGPLSAIDIRGISGANLGDTWIDGPRTFLGLFACDFPNMFMVSP